MTNTMPWSGGKLEEISTPELLTEAEGKFEPSGFTIMNHDDGSDWLYLVNGNTTIMRLDLTPGGKWEKFVIHDTSHVGIRFDAEAITISGEDTLLVGLEGATRNVAPLPNPLVVEYRPTALSSGGVVATGSSWELMGMELKARNGMEGFTFVPRGECPSTWQEESRGYGGYFFAATQAAPGVIYVYDLPRGNGTKQTVQPSFRLVSQPELKLKISDLFFSLSRKILYVLFDDEIEEDSGTSFISVLQGLQVEGDHFKSIGDMHMKYCGCEAVAEYQGDLYIGLDQSGDQMRQNEELGKRNYVFRCRGFTFPSQGSQAIPPTLWNREEP